MRRVLDWLVTVPFLLAFGLTLAVFDPLQRIARLFGQRPQEIVAGALQRLVDGGWLFLEHGYDQAASARGLLADAGFAAIASWNDLAGIERVTGGRWLGRRG